MNLESNKNSNNSTKKKSANLLNILNNSSSSIGTRPLSASKLPPINILNDENDLINKKGNKITIDDVLKLTKPTKGYLCDLNDNSYNIEFIGFKIRDIQTNKILFQINKPPSSNNDDSSNEQSRFIRYQFTPEFLNLKSIGAT